MMPFALSRIRVAIAATVFTGSLFASESIRAEEPLFTTGPACTLSGHVEERNGAARETFWEYEGLKRPCKVRRKAPECGIESWVDGTKWFVEKHTDWYYGDGCVAGG